MSESQASQPVADAAQSQSTSTESTSGNYQSNYTSESSDGGGRDLQVNTNYDPSYSEKKGVDIGSTGEPQYDSTFVEKIPEEYRAKPYMEGIKNFDDLMKQFDNAQSLIGKKPFDIPHENSSKEQWDQFYSKLGRPESPDKYEFQNPENLPEGFKVDPEVDNTVKNLFHEAGLSNQQAQSIRNKYMEAMAKKAEEHERQLDEQFDKLSMEVFGNRKEEALNKAQAMISQYLPESMHGAWQNLDSNSLVVLASVLDGVARDYGTEDSLDGSSQMNAMSDEQRRSERQALLNHPAMKDELHRDHEKIKQRYNELWK